MLKLRVGEVMLDLSIVRQEEQSFAVGIESSGRINVSRKGTELPQGLPRTFACEL
jgi:hypothetical protein